MSGFLLLNEMQYCKHGDREAHKGWAKNRSRFFSANFRRQYLGNGLSDLLKVDVQRVTNSHPKCAPMDRKTIKIIEDSRGGSLPPGRICTFWRFHPLTFCLSQSGTTETMRESSAPQGGIIFRHIFMFSGLSYDLPKRIHS